MHKSAEIIRRGYQAFNTADMKTLTEILDENASWHTPGKGSIAGDRKGRVVSGREHFYNLHAWEEFWS